MTSPDRDEWNRLLLLQNTLAHARHEIPNYFHIYIQQVTLTYIAAQNPILVSCTDLKMNNLETVIILHLEHAIT